jgi:hypothetical protein
MGPLQTKNRLPKRTAAADHRALEKAREINGENKSVYHRLHFART